MGICKHNNFAPDNVLEELHWGQEGRQRHKCTECAFEAGRQFGLQHSLTPPGNAECTYTNARAPEDVIDNLPDSQAGPGRHKCAVCAFHRGFETGRTQAASQSQPK